jgi:hypothetical protein
MNLSRQRAATAAIALLAGLLSWHPLREADLFWHLSLGRAVWLQRTRTVVDPMAWETFRRAAPVAEWLWDVLAFGVFQLGGFAALSLLVTTCVLMVAPLGAFALRARANDTLGAHVASLGALTVFCLSRMRERPETAALLLLLVTVGLARRLADATSTPHARNLGAAIVLCTLVWAQLHSTFVLAPVVVLCACAPRMLDALRTRTLAPARTPLVVAAAAGLMLPSSAHGVGVVAALTHHAHGDAVRHIADMASPTWSSFDPARSLYAPLYAALALLCGVLALMGRRVHTGSLALALLGVPLWMTASRGFALAGVLLAPLLRDMLSADDDRPHPRRDALAIAATVLVFALTASRIHTRFGPLGALGLRGATVPELGPRLLGAALPGARALTTFEVGAASFFFSSERLRVWIDARTPVYYDDAAYGLARDVWRDADALRLAEQRYRFNVAVTERNGALCEHLARTAAWIAVAVEPAHTTFVHRSVAARLVPSVLSPCGAEYVAQSMCSTLPRVDAEVTRLEGISDRGFADFVRAVVALRCRVPVPPAMVDTWLAAAAQRDDAPYAAERDRVRAATLASRNEHDAALDVLAPHVIHGDLRATAMLVAIARAGGKISHARSVLDEATQTLDDAAPATLRAELASVCAVVGDLECAREQGLRAAARGSAAAVSALCVVAQRHRGAAVRDDARRWIDTLRVSGVAPTAECR